MIEAFFVESSIFPLLLFIVVVVVAFKIIKGTREWSQNNKQPILTINSRVISMRTKKIRQYHNLKDNQPTPTDYFATFEISNSQPQEFQLTKKEFYQVSEGDIGKLTYQGTRFHSFEKVTT